MPVKFKLKNRKWRGRTSRGWGAKKKRRGGGSRGGRGFGGTHKHKFSWVTTMSPDHFGRKGFYSQSVRGKALNVEDIEKMESNEIDLTKLGYGKLLGRGILTRSVTITVDSASAKAKDKVEKAGGQVNITVPKTVKTQTQPKKVKVVKK